MTSPITPPPELVQQWVGGAFLSDVHHNEEDLAYEQYIAERAAQWGADQELEACCEWIKSELRGQLRPAHRIAIELRDARRPKPPSLKEQALGILDVAHHDVLEDDQIATIRRALEQLDD
jgi:hypothetical protein